MTLSSFGAAFDDWPYSMALRLNTSPTGADIAGDVEDFPVLVRLEEGNFDFSQTKSDGSDIRFSKSDLQGETIELPSKIERWDNTAKVAEVWVKVDVIKGQDADQIISMHWGNLFASSASSGPVFPLDKGFRAVYHIAESPGEVSGGFKDATPNGYNATGQGGMPPNSPTPGKIGNAQWFDGLTDYIDLPNLPNSPTATVSAWYTMDVLKSNAGILSNGGWASGVVHFKNNNGALTADPHSGTSASKTGQVTGSWYYVTYTYNKNGPLKLYVQGTLVATGAAPNNDWVGSNLEIGHEHSNYASGNRYFKGIIDEVRIETAVRSDDWIKLCYENQKHSQRLVQFLNLPFTSAGGDVYGDIDMNGYNLPELGGVVTKKWKIIPPDYVFDPSYTVPSLSSVDAFIKTKGHLPGIPSAVELSERGMDLGTLNLQILKQVEHMHLYLIDQDARLHLLEKRNRVTK